MSQASSPTGNTSSEYFRAQEERLDHLTDFSRKLAAALANYSQGDATKSAQVISNLSTRCPRCEIRLTGEELLCLPRKDECSQSPKLQRVHLGYCARNGCNSPVYEVIFHRNPEMDWNLFFQQVDATAKERDAAVGTVKTAQMVVHRKRQLQKSARIGIGLLAIVVLLMVWQWWRGQPIPIIHKAEKFHVTVLPEDPKRPGR